MESTAREYPARAVRPPTSATAMTSAVAAKPPDIRRTLDLRMAARRARAGRSTRTELPARGWPRRVRRRDPAAPGAAVALHAHVDGRPTGPNRRRPGGQHTGGRVLPPGHLDLRRGGVVAARPRVARR